jgi:hypothetical protein
MKRTDRKQQKKRKKEDAKRKARHSYNEQARRIFSRQAKYPDTVFNDTEGTPEFVALVKEAQQKIDLDDPSVCDPLLRKAYHRIREVGIKAFTQEAIAGAGSDPVKQNLVDIWLHKLMLHYGTHVFNLIPVEKRRRLLPFNDVFIYFAESVQVFEFSSLLTAQGHKKPIYYSRKKPQVTLGPSKWPVGFDAHAIEQAAARLNPQYWDYSRSADVHAFFAQCVYFEEAEIDSRNHPHQPAFCMYDTCNDPTFVSYDVYVNTIFGADGKLSDRSKGDFYYRLGYFPVKFENGFAKATTFMRPGYTGTPELQLLRNDRKLERNKKAFLLRESRQHKGQEVLRSGRTEIIKWFHDNGCPQVVQFKHQVFDRSAAKASQPLTASTWFTRAKRFLRTLGKKK